MNPKESSLIEAQHYWKLLECVLDSGEVKWHRESLRAERPSGAYRILFNQGQGTLYEALDKHRKLS